MASFAYVAQGPDGQRVTGQLEVPDSRAAAARLRAQGCVPLSIRAVAASGVAATNPAAASPQAAASLPSLWARRRTKVSAVELQQFTREFYALIKAGIPVTRALDVISSSTDSPGVLSLLRDIRAQLDSGLDLADAFERANERHQVFSAYYLAVLRVGNYTGRLEQVLSGLARHLEFQRVSRNQIVAAVRYPLFVLLAAAVALVVVNLFVLPQFARVFASTGHPLPWLTRGLLAFSAACVQGWPVALGLVVAGGLWLRSWLRRPQGRAFCDQWLLRVPLIGPIFMQLYLSRFATALALVLRSGVPLVQGVGLVADTVGNQRFAQATLALQQRVANGESIVSAATAVRLFPPTTLRVIAVGEESGSLDLLIDELGDFYRSEVEYAIAGLGARLEPVLIAGLGLVVLVLALGVFEPMWELGRAASHRS